MRPHPRIRKCVKWGGLALTVGTIALWGASAKVMFRWIVHPEPEATFVLTVAHGSLDIISPRYDDAIVEWPSGLLVRAQPEVELDWWFSYYPGPQTAWQ